MSASRLLFLSLAGLLILDVGRSLHTRSVAGVAAPSSRRAAQRVAWPPGSDLAADTPTGKRVYAQHCAVCHGVDGKGDGPAAPALRPQPRDFSGGVFKYKSSASSQAPRLEDVRRSIRDGLAGTSMPAWKDLLSGEQIDAVAEYLRGFGPVAEWTADAGTEDTSAPLFESADSERGRKRYVALGCPACHGDGARGDGQSAPDLRDVWKRPAPPRDLTAPWEYRWGNDRAAVYRWIAGGVSGTPMPGYLEVAEPQEIADVVVYLESIARRPPWAGGDQPGGDDDRLRRGEYLVRTGMCAMCHTPVDADGIYLAGTHALAGGMRISAGPHGVFFSANLTPDDATGLGAWSEAQIAAAIQTGHTPERRQSYWAMPWQVYGALLPDDAMAIATYLKSRPAVSNRVPEPLYYGSVETVARKLVSQWPALPPPQLTYASGNFGSAEPGSGDGTSTQTWLLRAQRLLLAIAVVAWLLARRRRRSEQSHGGASMTAGLLLLVGLAAVAFVERYPALGPLPPGPIIGAFVETIAPVTEDDPQRQLRLRGRYLFAVSSCAFCHGGDGSGGNKASWRGFGTVWSANLTPGGELASWTDDDILRALRSGVRRDGRQIHWQAMPWDAFSNYREEDLRSLVAYIRGLPAVATSPRQAVPPAASDCTDYTFWVAPGGDADGCE